MVRFIKPNHSDPVLSKGRASPKRPTAETTWLETDPTFFAVAGDGLAGHLLAIHFALAFDTMIAEATVALF